MSSNHSTPRRPLQRILAGTCALALGASLAACSASKESTDAAKPEDGNTVKAVATTTQICDYLTQIAAGGVKLHKVDSQGAETTSGEGPVTLDLTCLLAPNASAHEHEMTPQQMQALSQADYMFVNGVDLEHFLDQAVDSSGFHGVMAVTSGVKSEGMSDGNGKYTIDEGIEHVSPRPWPFPGEDGEAPEFKYDPHVWTSPKQAKIQVDNIVNTLSQASPQAKDAFTAAGKKYTDQLEDLDKWASDSMSAVPEQDRVLFSSHDAFGYFSNEYGVKFIGSALSDFNHQQDATSSHIDEQVKKVRESGAKAIFAENSNNSKSIEAIARAAGVKAVTSDDALYGDSLGVPGSEGETYIGSIVHNINTLVSAWDSEQQPLPESLQAFDVAKRK
ncbi:metal ABC transporter substrate-binding protein [Corynebacterium striatum]|uniref:metal ABC transporter substrate-binding protein n=1 Tax=Corynebacterium striatum TaxID=43770 RepID=UPI001FC8E288|nr:metal ABC transporter substrate-binding protein [Corynebacterium striatum]GKH16084.1 ABC transporter substrate-binding protein [Corynebacterium striatum]